MAVRILEPSTYPTWKGYTMKVQIRRLIEPVAAFECQCCGKTVKRAGKFEFRPSQYTIEHIPKRQICCRNCCYKLTYASKGIMKFKKANTIENESYKYANTD